MKKIASLQARIRADVAPLNDNITIVDGVNHIADNHRSDSEMCHNFEQYIVSTYGR